MAQIPNPDKIFGEVNTYAQPDGTIQIVATILNKPTIEGAQTGLALDASVSMQSMYGASSAVNPIFAKASSAINHVEPVARTMIDTLADISCNGSTRLIYWAVSTDGSQIEDIGDINSLAAETIHISGPKKQKWGRGTKLLAPVQYFAETVFSKAPWSMAVIITDGKFDDLQEVKAYTLELGRRIAAGNSPFIKFVLLGVGTEVDEGQMEQLDDLFEGTGLVDPKGDDIDIWDHKLANKMNQLEDIFSEIVSENVPIADFGTILNDKGIIAREYNDGLPSLLRFTLPAGSTSFTIKLPAGEITQEIS